MVKVEIFSHVLFEENKHKVVQPVSVSLAGAITCDRAKASQTEKITWGLASKNQG